MSNDPLSGIWFSGVRSELHLEVDGSTLTGYFQSTDDPSAGKQPLHGSVDPDTGKPNRALSFSVFWPKSSSFPAAVTSYTGQFHSNGGSESSQQISTVFLLAEATEPKDNFRAVNVAFDMFHRNKP